MTADQMPGLVSESSALIMLLLRPRRYWVMCLASVVIVILSQTAIGQVVGWGSTMFFYAEPGTKFVGIAAGGAHSLVLGYDGKVIGCGSRNGATVPVGLSNIVAIAAGGNHSLGLKSDGTAIVWGSSYFGQTSIPSGLK